MKRQPRDAQRRFSSANIAANVYMEHKSICRPRILSSPLLGIVALLFPLELLGAEPPGAVPPGAEPPVEQTKTTGFFSPFYASRDYLSGQLVGFASYVDRFFGDPRNFLETNKSVVQLDIARVMGYGGEHKFALSGRAKFELPATEKRWKLILETDPDKNPTGVPAQVQPVPPQVGPPESFGAGLRYEKAEESLWHFSSDVGVHFHGLPNDPFVRTRVRFAVPMDQWRLKAAETAFWFRILGAGESTEIELERLLSKPVLFRATTNATWLNNTRNLDLRQDFSIYHTMDERTALLYQVSATGVISQAQTYVADYVVLMNYRYRLHKQWVFFDLSPQLHFPKEKNFKPSPMLSLRLEILFDESR